MSRLTCYLPNIKNQKKTTRENQKIRKLKKGIKGRAGGRKGWVWRGCHLLPSLARSRPYLKQVWVWGGRGRSKRPPSNPKLVRGWALPGGSVFFFWFPFFFGEGGEGEGRRGNPPPSVPHREAAEAWAHRSGTAGPDLLSSTSGRAKKELYSFELLNLWMASFTSAMQSCRL